MQRERRAISPPSKNSRRQAASLQNHVNSSITISPKSDYAIHEAAHIFHNCKREMIGLPATRRREWLLDIDYAKRETFAYACEAYSRILELG